MTFVSRSDELYQTLSQSFFLISGVGRCQELINESCACSSLHENTVKIGQDVGNPKVSISLQIILKAANFFLLKCLKTMFRNDVTKTWN